MAYSIEFKKEVVLRVKNGENVSDVSKDVGVSAASIYNWLKKEELIPDEIKSMSSVEQEEIEENK